MENKTFSKSDGNVSVTVDINQLSNHREIGLQVGDQVVWTSSRNAWELVENRFRAQEGRNQSAVTLQSLGFAEQISDIDSSRLVSLLEDIHDMLAAMSGRRP